MPGPEARVERKCRELAEADGWLFEKIRFLSRTGCPDRLLAKEGRIVLVEFKAKGKVLEPHQQVMVWELEAAGIEVKVIDHIEAFKREVLGWTED